MQDLTIKKALSLAPRLPQLDREVLLSHILGKDRVFLMAHSETRLTPGQAKRYQNFLTRRAKHEPIAYITGVREFYGRNFFVGPGVLIPRPETELIVEHAVKNISSRITSKKKCAVIDVGTGSGAIITSVFLSLEPAAQKNISWFAVDTELAALRYARKNARHHGVTPTVQFVKSDLLSGVKKKLLNYDEVFIIANLPYLSKALYRSTAPNVRRYEPKSALESGTDGLDHYGRLLAELQSLQLAGIRVQFFFEISPEQAKKLPSLLSGYQLLSTLEIVPDLAGKARVLIGNFITSI